MSPRALSVAAVLLWAGPALAQSSAAFPDLPRRPVSVPAAATPDAAPVERPAASELPLREPAFGSPAPQPASFGYSPSFAGGSAPTFAPSFAPRAPTADAPPGEPSGAGASSTLLVIGGLVLGLPYATGIGIGASESFENGSGWLAAPVAGPWLSLSARRDPCADSEQKQEFDSDVGKCVAEPLVRGMLVLDGVLQATGALILIIGASAGDSAKPRREPAPLVAAPAPMGRAGYGVAVAGGF